MRAVRLTEVFRQAAHSRIIRNAHRINRGELPEAGASGEESDFFFIERAERAVINASEVQVALTAVAFWMVRKSG